MADSAHFQTPLKSVKRSRVLKDSTNSMFVTPEPKSAKTLCIPPSPSLQRLGSGTGVNVFLMDQPATPRGTLKSPWAIKKINSKLGKSKSDLKTFEERLAYEADILKSINHKNIVGYRDTVRGTDGSMCLCMESGEKSLHNVIECKQEEADGCFSPEQIHKVLYSVSQALSYLHRTKKLLHGDIKSQNILVKGDFEEIKLCDFGVSLKLRDDLQGLANDTDCYVGTGPWSSMEALEDGLITDRSDIYSLGCVIYEMLTLTIPHMPPLMSDDSGDANLSQSFDEDAFVDAQGTVPTLPNNVYDRKYHPYITLMTICCCEDSAARPAAQEICETLQLLKEKPI